MQISDVSGHCFPRGGSCTKIGAPAQEEESSPAMTEGPVLALPRRHHELLSDTSVNRSTLEAPVHACGVVLLIEPAAATAAAALRSFGRPLFRVRVSGVAPLFATRLCASLASHEAGRSVIRSAHSKETTLTGVRMFRLYFVSDRLR